MGQILINIGTSENSGDGDAINVAGSKINSNFTELYARPSVLSHIGMFQNNISSTLTNADITLQPSGTGSVVFPAIKINDNNIEGTRSNEDIKIIPSGSGSVVFAGVGFSGTSISSADSTTINFNENVITDGTFSASGNATLSGSLEVGTTLTATGGLTTLSQMSVTGTTTLGTTNIDNISIDDNIISTSSNADLIFTPGGTGQVNITNLTIDSAINMTDNEISVTTSNADLKLSASGTGDIVLAGIRIHGTTFSSDDSSTINFNDALIIDGAVTISGAVTFDSDLAVNNNVTVTGDLTVSTETTIPGPVEIDNLNINDNIISSDSNADIIFQPGGTGAVNISRLVVDSNITMTDNEISCTTSNADLVLTGSSSGKVNITSGEISGTIDNTVIGGTTPAAGTFTTLTFDPTNGGTINADGVTITDNTITTSASNANLEFLASGSGKVSINGFLLPTSDGSSGDIIKTDGSKNLSFEASSILLGQSDIQDAQNTIGFTSITDINANTAAGDHESITATASVIDEWAQAKYDSAFYHILTRTEAHDSSIEFAVQKMIIAQGTEDGSTFDSFGGASQIVNTTASPVLDQTVQLTTDIRSSKVRLLGQGGSSKDGSTTNAINALKYYRIGLGDNDSSVSDGKTTTIVVADLDSATANLDTFAKADYRGAKYYISINNTTSNEVESTEVLVIHNGTDAFIQEYNTIISNTTSDPLATFTADISGSNVRLRGANGTAGTCRVTMYRVLLADDESDSSGTHVSVIGAQTVTNTSQTTIDTNTFRGTASPDVSSQKVISSYDNTFDSVWYHAIHKDVTNQEFMIHKYSTLNGTTDDGSTQIAQLTDSSIVKTGAFNDINTVDVGISGSKIQLLATGESDGSTTIANATSYYAIGLGDNTVSSTIGLIGLEGGITLAGNNETEIDHVVATGTTQGSVAATRTGAQFTASQFNGAMFHVVTRDLANGSFETQKISVLHNFNDAFMTSSAVTSTDEADQHPTFDADMVTSDDSASAVRLRMTDSDGSSVTPSNTMAYYRIGIGDSDSTGYVGELGLQHDIMHVDIIGSTVVTLDQISHGAHVRAKYFINVRNQSTGECGNIEALVTHDGSSAYITSYNEVFSGNNSLITLTADISGSAFRLRGSATAGGSTKVVVNRIIAFGDSESDETNSDSTRKIIGNASVSSTATEFDTFMSSETDAAHYVITGQKGSDENFIGEATVVTDGTNVFVSQGPMLSTKDTDMIEVSATISSGTVSVKAASTSGASTVQAYAVKLKAPAVATGTVDSWAISSYRGAKYYISAKNNLGETHNIEALVVHDGSDAYITTYNTHFTNISLISLTAAVSGGNLILTGTPATADVVVKFYRIRLADNESNASGADSKVIDATVVGSSATLIDTFNDPNQTGAHYIIVATNSSEGASSIMEANLITNGVDAFVSGGPKVSSKDSDQITLTADHNGSQTVSLRAASTSGSSTTVNAFRIHMLRGDAQPYTVLDSFAHSTYQGAFYVAVGKNEDSQCQIADLAIASDGTDAYINATPNISTHSTTDPVVNFTAGINGSNVELRGQNQTENTNTTVNMYRIHLARAAGNPSSIATLDSFSATDFRAAKYTVSISDTASGDLGLYETCDVNLTHDASTVFLSVHGRVTNHTEDLVTFSADIDSGNVRLRGTISNTNSHTVTVVRRVIKI